jgi:hypothetical protein
MLARLTSFVMLPVGIREQHVGNDGLLVHVQSTAAWMYDVHQYLPGYSGTGCDLTHEKGHPAMGV